MNKTGIVRDERYLNHHMGPSHPESPSRLEAIYAMLEESDMTDIFQVVPARKAEREELLLVHSMDYIDRIAATEGKKHTYLDPDTQASAGSYEAALLAAGGLCAIISKVHSGELDNAFALVRPPGHHAEGRRAMGFCLFNNVAVGARFAQEELNLKRILVVDWDLHHGNGTQHSFEEDSSILYFSSHQYPYYPGSGAFDEVGTNKGEGFTVNVPLSTGYGDAEFVTLFEEILKPVTLEFDPELILLSAGFDTYMDDPLGGMSVTPVGFAGMTRSIMALADECCGGKLVVTLEGGYNLQGLRDSVKAVLREMAGLQKTDIFQLMSQTKREMLNPVLERVKEIQKRYWKAFDPNVAS